MSEEKNNKVVSKENGKKMWALEREHYSVKDGKVVIESEELANAIQEKGLDLFIDEEQAAVVADGIGFACPCVGAQ